MSTVTKTRKQLEIERREAEIRDCARRRLVQEGYHGLNMDQIAATIGVSKGTVYNHFQNKEEILIALTIDTMRVRLDLFERATLFQGKSRERLMAIGVAAELFVRLYPEHFQVESIIRAASIWEKTSEKRRQAMRDCESQCVSIVGGVVRDAVAQGDLTLPEDMTPEDVVFGLWALNLGAFTIIASSQSLPDYGIKNPASALWLAIEHLLDGHQWKPLSHEHDYQTIRQRIEDEVFHDEFQRLD